jgi:hypothetical protein
MTIEVITSITGDKDWLRNDHVPSGAKFTAYTDRPYESKIWEIKPAYNKFTDPRRNSRIHKILIHKYSKADVTIWVDGNMRFVVPPEEIVEKYLTGYDMAMFQHGARDCIYDEALTCAKLGLDDPEIIIEQAKHYEDNEYGKHKGLCSGYFIIRRNNQKTRNMNEFWWADYCRFSRRDQISLMPAIDKAGVNINIIPEVWVQGDGYASMGGVVTIRHHKHFEGNFNEKK